MEDCADLLPQYTKSLQLGT
ncbi:hypothetical protein CGLO_13081 [Colletotrichum gloeosporioides Cg-14]|uniref:Uncharacterized protein n=1 Tax=Colletotrichum gloeosporioides (strain Cg-14) TaxID=1237896 RepID=T0K6Y9_COLGC|nr:hypothetical protein CGLO_13081 [Colletotrichum gloeosporioides Cg-14]